LFGKLFGSIHKIVDAKTAKVASVVHTVANAAFNHAEKKIALISAVENAAKAHVAKKMAVVKQIVHKAKQSSWIY
jgi:hypothetical protein